MPLHGKAAPTPPSTINESFVPSKSSKSSTERLSRELIAECVTPSRSNRDAQYDNFSLLDSERQPPAEPTLRWQVTSQDTAEHKLEFAYATGGLAWRAEYLARVAPGEDCKLALEGAAMVANRSGVSFRNVALTLVAGEPNRVREDAPQMYHLFFGDGAGTPGSDITIFDMPRAAPEIRGNNAI